MLVYKESHIFGSRTTTIDEGKIIAEADGMFFPRYKETFDLKDVQKYPSEIYMANHLMYRPLMLITVIAILSIFFVVPFKDDLPFFLAAIPLVVAVIAGSLTMLLILKKTKWILFKYKSGTGAFTLSKYGQGIEKMEEFARLVTNEIASAHGHSDA